MTAPLTSGTLACVIATPHPADAPRPGPRAAAIAALRAACERCGAPVLDVALGDARALTLLEGPVARLSPRGGDLVSMGRDRGRLLHGVAHRHVILAGEPSPELLALLAAHARRLLAPRDACATLATDDALERPARWSDALAPAGPAIGGDEHNRVKVFAAAPYPAPARVLYWINGAIASWQVLLALHELGLEFAPRRLRVVGARDTETPEFLALSPRGQAPVLIEPDGAVVLESLAQLHFLARIHDREDAPLLPREPAALAVALSRAHETAQLRAAYRPLETLLLPPAQRDPVQVRAAIATLDALPRELSRWEPLARAHAFIAGDARTLADCVFYPALAYQLRRGLPLAPRFPALADYAARMAARPAAIRARPIGWDLPASRNLFEEARELRPHD